LFKELAFEGKKEKKPLSTVKRTDVGFAKGGFTLDKKGDRGAGKEKNERGAPLRRDAQAGKGGSDICLREKKMGKPGKGKKRGRRKERDRCGPVRSPCQLRTTCKRPGVRLDERGKKKEPTRRPLSARLKRIRQGKKRLSDPCPTKKKEKHRSGSRARRGLSAAQRT